MLWKFLLGCCISLVNGTSRTHSQDDQTLKMLSKVYFSPGENDLLLERPPTTNVVAASKSYFEVMDERKGKRGGKKVSNGGRNKINCQPKVT